MDDLQCHVILNSISVISERRGDDKRLSAMEPRLRLKKINPPAAEIKHSLLVWQPGSGCSKLTMSLVNV